MHRNGHPVLEARALQAGYDGSAVSGPLTIQLHAGTALALAGGNGAGKSTLLRTLCGRQEPVAGEVRFDGGPVDDRTVQFRRSVAAVFDDDAFFPSLTVAEHLLLTALGHGRAEPRAAVEHELDFFGLAGHADAFSHSLSSGQRRRVLLASALVRPFALLVLDEPEQRLDHGMRSRLAARLVERTADGAC
ncbi:MAG: ATP-binding cassette domain-containing protein, partial [Actinomycetes bacterium]